MSIIRDPATMLAMLEGDTFGTKFRAEMIKVVKTLSDLAGEKGTAKGTLNLKIKFDMKGQTCEITPEVSSKLSDGEGNARDAVRHAQRRTFRRAPAPTGDVPAQDRWRARHRDRRLTQGENDGFRH